MFDLLYKTLLIFPLLSGCVTTIDYTLPLANKFEANSEYFLISPPAWRVPDSVYERELNEYSISNVHTSSKDLSSKISDTYREYNILEYFIFDKKLSKKVKEFTVRKSVKYSFDLTKDESLIASSRCESLSSSVFEKVKKESDDEHSFNRPDFKSRLKTALTCTINHGDIIWELVLKSSRENEILIQLKNTNQSYDINLLTHISILRDGEKSTLDSEINILPRNGEIISGLEYFYNGEQVAAFSFTGKSKIWLNNHLPEDSRALLLAVNYSLAMFDWLDDEWQ